MNFSTQTFSGKAPFKTEGEALLPCVDSQIFLYANRRLFKNFKKNFLTLFSHSRNQIGFAGMRPRLTHKREILSAVLSRKGIIKYGSRKFLLRNIKKTSLRIEKAQRKLTENFNIGSFYSLRPKSQFYHLIAMRGPLV